MAISSTCWFEDKVVVTPKSRNKKEIAEIEEKDQKSTKARGDSAQI